LLEEQLHTLMAGREKEEQSNDDESNQGYQEDQSGEEQQSRGQMLVSLGVHGQPQDKEGADALHSGQHAQQEQQQQQQQQSDASHS